MLASAINLTADSTVQSTRLERIKRVLILSDHPAESRDVAKNLRNLELDVQLSLFDGNTLSAMPKRAPDAVLCHLTDYAELAPKLARVVRSHFNSRPFPIIGAISRPTEHASEGFDSTLFAPMHASQIANRVNAMIRLGMMEAEIERRLETLREDFNQTPELNKLGADRKFRVLFIGKASPSFMVIINALQDKGVDVIAAFTSFSAFDYLHGEPFDAVVMNALEQSEPAFSISQAMRRNSKLYHTPTLFLVDGKTFDRHEAAYERGARDIIDMHSDSDEISGRILELANYHRVHEQMKSDFKTLFSDVAGDETQTAYSQNFLKAHLPRMMRDAKNSNHPVTLLGVKLLPSSVDKVAPAVIEAAFKQTIELIGNLVRMQDVLCRWNTDNVVLAFYNTDKTETKTILGRINELINCAVYESGRPHDNGLSISTQATIMELPPQSPGAANILDKLVANLNHDPDQD